MDGRRVQKWIYAILIAMLMFSFSGSWTEAQTYGDLGFVLNLNPNITKYTTTNNFYGGAWSNGSGFIYPNSSYSQNVNISGGSLYWAGNDCGANNYLYGIFPNGTLKCRVDQTLAGGETDPLWSGNYSLVAFTSSQGSWNVNGSNFWDNLDSPLSSWTDTSNSTYSATSADVATNKAQWANQTATDVQCGTTCVADAEIAGMSWSKLASYVLNSAWTGLLGWGNLSGYNLNVAWIGSLGWGNLSGVPALGNTTAQIWTVANNGTFYLYTNPYNFWNSTWAGMNKTYTDTLYYGISNPSNFWNTTWSGFNKTYADTLYYLVTNPSGFWNNTWAGFNKTYADTLYAPINEPLWAGNMTAALNQTATAVNCTNCVADAHVVDDLTIVSTKNINTTQTFYGTTMCLTNGYSCNVKVNGSGIYFNVSGSYSKYIFWNSTGVYIQG